MEAVEAAQAAQAAAEAAALETDAGLEIAYAERSTTYTNTQTAAGASAIISGLTINVPGNDRPVDIVFYAPNVWHSVANTLVTAYLSKDGAGLSVNGNIGSASSAATTAGTMLYVHRRIVIPDGETWQYQVGIFGAAAGTNNVGASANAVMSLMATRR
jgi:hypothetical protein